MNKKQLVVMWVGILIFILFGLSTQTQYSYHNNVRDLSQRTTVVDYGPMCVRLGSTALVTAVLIYTLKDKKPKDEQKQ